MESIISSGLDMYDKGPDGSTTPASSPMSKLKFMHKVGVGYFYAPTSTPTTKKSMFGEITKMIFEV
jgi:hypothetical protein